MSELRAWVNGRLVEASAPALAVTDRGFQLGDGVFETLRVRRGVPIELALHLERLRDGLRVLEIPLQASDDALVGAIAEVVASNGPDDAAVRITISRGAPVARGLLPPGLHDAPPTIVIQAWPHHGAPQALRDRGLRLVTSVQRRDPAHPLASVKTTSRADHVLAKLEASRAGVDDALVLTLDGAVAEATTANIAALIDATGGPVGAGPVGAGPVGAGPVGGALELITPPLSAGILPGTTRDWLLSPAGAAALGLAATEASITPARLLAAREVFLCSSVAGIVACVEVDGQPIGDGRPGPWAARLREAREAWIRDQAGG